MTISTKPNSLLLRPMIREASPLCIQLLMIIFFDIWLTRSPSKFFIYVPWCPTLSCSVFLYFNELANAFSCWCPSSYWSSLVEHTESTYSANNKPGRKNLQIKVDKYQSILIYYAPSLNKDFGQTDFPLNKFISAKASIF